MGKVTGFLEFERQEETYAPPAERKQNYKEFVLRLKDDDAKVQGARCMDCGIPFCNNGCPVNNIIPDWNDLVYADDMQRALTVLHQTNNFPDVTGRIYQCQLSGGQSRVAFSDNDGGSALTTTFARRDNGGLTQK